MNDHDLDALYTRLCRTLTAAGQAQAPLLLARFALLAMTHIADPPAIERMIDAAADGVGPADNDARRPS